MDIYLAASWPQRKRMRVIAQHLQQIGHSITSDWILSRDPVGMGPEEIAVDPAKALNGGVRDLVGIKNADLVAVFTDISSSTGGFHVEFGYALGKGKHIDIIGPKPNVFYALVEMPAVRHFNRLDEWFDQLRKDKES